jgi:DNA-binding CsgD family transcriptional regulator
MCRQPSVTRILILSDRVAFASITRHSSLTNCEVSQIADGRAYLDAMLELKTEEIVLYIVKPCDLETGWELIHKRERSPHTDKMLSYNCSERGENSAEPGSRGSGPGIDKGSPSLLGLTPEIAHVSEELPGLTRRESEVLRMLVSGLRMKEIGYHLGITYRTVAFHKYRLMDKLNMRTNADLVHFAFRYYNLDGRAERTSALSAPNQRAGDAPHQARAKSTPAAS